MNKNQGFKNELSQHFHFKPPVLKNLVKAKVLSKGFITGVAVQVHWWKLLDEDGIIVSYHILSTICDCKGGGARVAA